MDRLLKDIMGVIGNECMSFHIYDGNVWFELFDKVVITVELEDNQAVVESFDCKLDSYRLVQLYTVVDLIDKNIDVIKKII